MKENEHSNLLAIIALVAIVCIAALTMVFALETQNKMGGKESVISLYDNTANPENHVGSYTGSNLPSKKQVNP